MGRAAPRVPVAWCGFVFLTILLAHGAVVWRIGVLRAPDTTTYSRWADGLIAHRFNYAGFLPEVDSPLGVSYLGWLTLVAVAKLVAGTHWGGAIAGVNLVADALVGMLLWLVTLTVTRRRAAAGAALTFYLLSFEIVNWTRFVVSDVTFLALTFSAFALAARALLREGPSGRARDWAAAGSLTAVGVIYRPPGIVLAPLAVVAAYLGRRPLDPDGHGVSRPFSLPALGACLIGVAAVTLLNAAVVQDPGRWPVSALAGAIRVQSNEYRRGEVVSARKETYHARPVALADYVLITADRFLHFFAPTAAGFGAAHRWSNLAWFVPVYAGAALGLAGLAGLGAGVGDTDGRRARVVALSVAVILAFAVFHALTQVDFDWRYRLPILPHLLFLAGVGMATVQDRWAGGRAGRVGDDGEHPQRGPAVRGGD